MTSFEEDVIELPKAKSGINASLPGALVNDTDSSNPRKRERMVHRAMANMCIAGFTQREIAHAFEYTECSVSEILRTPFIREYMLAEQHETLDDMKTLIALRGKEAFARLVNMSESATQESVKLKANTEIVNRWLGMPTQPIEQLNKPSEKKSDAELLASLSHVLAEGEPRTGMLSNDDTANSTRN